MSDMERSWLVQRLNKPRGHDSPFSFGGEEMWQKTSALFGVEIENDIRNQVEQA